MLALSFRSQRITAAALLLAASASNAYGLSSRSVGSPRGLQQLNTHLYDKLLDRRDIHSSSFRLEKIAGPTVYGLRAQLGAYVPEGSHNPFSGSRVNPFNLLIWQKVVDNLAAEAAGQCSNTAETFVLHFLDASSESDSERVIQAKIDSRMATLLLQVCHKSSTAASDVELHAALQRLWDVLIGYGLSAERDVWLAYLFHAEDGPLVIQPGPEALQSVLWTLFMHPYFYLIR